MSDAGHVFLVLVGFEMMEFARFAKNILVDRFEDCSKYRAYLEILKSFCEYEL